MKKTKSSRIFRRNENGSHVVEQLSKRRLWLFRIIALIIIPIIILSLVELGLRIFHFGYPTAALIESTENDTNYVYENLDFSKRFFPGKLAQEFVPIRFKADKPKGVYRIFILGGSAAQGIPDPAYSFGRILDVMLKLRYPDTQFEILPLAMTAINSHVVLEIAKDCIEYGPDLFIVYLGNNEVVGPYGPGTILTPIISNSLLLQLTISLKATKISQLITMGLENLNIVNSPHNSWKGLEMFTQNQIKISDPELEITYQNFSDNLKSLNKISQENNVKIIYNTVVSNLKDSPPFNSAHRSNIQYSELQKWEGHYSTGSSFEEVGDYASAMAEYIKAVKIDNQYANLNYKLGRCYWKTGDFKEANKKYILAREYDSNRFRADNRINEIIRSMAIEIPGITFLSDALSEIEGQSPNRVPGNEVLFEHVHLNFKGNYLVAKTNFNLLEHIFSEVLKDQRKVELDQITDSICAASLAYDNFEHYRISELVLNGFMKQPPFTNQLYHEETIKHLETELDSLKEAVLSQDSNRTINVFEDALLKRPTDWFLHNKFADYLADDNIRKYQKAADHYLFVMNIIPHDPDVVVKRGVVLAKLGKLDESLEHFQKALEINSTLAKAYFNSGLIYQKLNNLNLAVENYRNAANYDPTHSKAFNNLASIYSNKGDNYKALETIELGLKSIPNDLLLNYNMAMILYKSNRKAEAIQKLRSVIQMAPNDMRIQDKLNEWLENEK